MSAGVVCGGHIAVGHSAGGGFTVEVGVRGVWAGMWTQRWGCVCAGGVGVVGVVSVVAGWWVMWCSNCLCVFHDVGPRFVCGVVGWIALAFLVWSC